MSWGEVELESEVADWRAARAGGRGRPAYWIAPGRRIVLLTVFEKAQRRERGEVRRARAAMDRCMTQEHVVMDEE